jgi:hypothetical protein
MIGGVLSEKQVNCQARREGEKNVNYGNKIKKKKRI